MKVSIINYGAVCSAGQGVTSFLSALDSGCVTRDSDGVHRIPRHPSASSEAHLVSLLLACWKETCARLPFGSLHSDLGILLASTKGSIEDTVWKGAEFQSRNDSLGALLRAFIAQAELNPVRSTVMSNACASSHAALFLARKWLLSGVVKRVLVLACDEAGPFITQGFRSLKALSPTGSRPFSQDRDGLSLGEGAAAMLLSSVDEGDLVLRNVALDTEGYAVTRPSPSGKSLARACQRVLEEEGISEDSIDGIIAHATATLANDSAEDATFGALFLKTRPWVTGTKWCIGHTLGASGLMDTIAAAEILRRQRPFVIQTTQKLDPKFSIPVLTAQSVLETTTPLHRLLVSSLGFGGTHAALVIEKAHL